MLESKEIERPLDYLHMSLIKPFIRVLVKLVYYGGPEAEANQAIYQSFGKAGLPTVALKLKRV